MIIFCDSNAFFPIAISIFLAISNAFQMHFARKSCILVKNSSFWPKKMYQAKHRLFGSKKCCISVKNENFGLFRISSKFPKFQQSFSNEIGKI